MAFRLPLSRWSTTMNRRSLLLPACAVLHLLLAGCGEALAAWPPVNTAAAMEEDLDGSLSGGNPFDARCQAACSVVKTGAGMCPYTSAGHGSSSLLEGCARACGKAKEEAGVKIPPGCVVQTCEYSGC
jgi:hypothetical protein